MSGTNIWLLKILQTFPILTFMYSCWLLYVALEILHETDQNTVYFLFLAFQVYINWLAIVCVSSNCISAQVNCLKSSSREKQEDVAVNLLSYDDKNYNFIYPHEKHQNFDTVKTSQDYDDKTCMYPNGRYADVDQQLTKKNIKYDYNEDFVSVGSYVSNVEIQKVWYCPKCCLNCLQNCHHCPLCNKCIFERDHHCFFLGACISRQNMKHFVVILAYTFIVCLYVVDLVCVEMNLYNDFAQDCKVVLRHFLPVSFSKWLAGLESGHNLMRIALLNTAASIALFSFFFALYNLYLVLSGQLTKKLQKNRRDQPTSMRDNFNIIFGDCGILNFVIPLGLAKNVFKTHLGFSTSAFKYN